MKKYVLLLLMAISISSGVQAAESKLNLFIEDFDSSYKNRSIDSIVTNEDGVFLQVANRSLRVEALQVLPNGVFVMKDGGWLSLEEAIQCDDFLYESAGFEFNTTMAFEKMWKCPYCFRLWPIGTPCGNPDCPSKY